MQINLHLFAVFLTQSGLLLTVVKDLGMQKTLFFFFLGVN